MRKSCAWLLLFLWLVPGMAWAQKIGILPFEDASGVGHGFGEQVAKFIRSEFLKDKRLMPKFIQYRPKGEDESESVDRRVLSEREGQEQFGERRGGLGVGVVRAQPSVEERVHQ